MDTLMGRYRNVSILAAAVFIQLIGLAVQIKRKTENDSTRLIRVWTITAVTPLEKAIVRLQTGTSNLWHSYVYLRGVRQENRDLQQEIQQLQLEQVRLRQDAEQARRLQALLGFKEQFIEQTVAAQVIGSSGSEQSRTVYLDKGTNDGIKTGMPVISARGIVGKVIQVLPRTSQVLLINDQTSGVGTILEQSRLQGVLKGKASGELALDKVMAEEDVKPGERVLTSGGDQIFPKGLLVGTVGDVARGKEFLDVTVKPATALTHLEEVLVITKKQEREPQVAGASSVRAADILAQRLPSVPDKPAEPTTGTGQPASAVSAKPATPGTAAAQSLAKPLSTPATGLTQSKPALPTTSGGQQPVTHSPGTAPITSPKTIPAAGASTPTTSNVPQAKTSAAGTNTLTTGNVPQHKVAAPGTNTLTAPKPTSGEAAEAVKHTPPANRTATKPSAPSGTTTQAPPQPESGDTPQ